MSWGVRDDREWQDTRLLSVPPTAYRLYMRALSWALGHSPDGIVPLATVEHVLSMRSDDYPADTQALVSAGLWRPTDGDDLQIVDWGIQTEFLAKGEQRKLAIASKRQGAGKHGVHVRDGVLDPECEHCGSTGEASGKQSGSTGEASGKQSGSKPKPNTNTNTNTKYTPTTPNGVVAPTGGEQPPAEKPKREPRGSRITEDFQPSAKAVAVIEAENLGVDLRFETVRFRDHFLAKAGADARKVDWDRAWCGWMRRAAEYAGRGNARAAGSSAPSLAPDPKVQAGLALIQKLKAEEERQARDQNPSSDFEILELTG